MRIVCFVLREREVMMWASITSAASSMMTILGAILCNIEWYLAAQLVVIPTTVA